MASLPPKPDAAEAARLAKASHIGQAANTVNKFARRDPALYPLVAIVGGIFCVAGYMMANKGTTDPARAFQRDVVNPWDDNAKHDVHPSQVAAFKYRYRNRDTGAIEDAHPTLNQDVRSIKSQVAHKFNTI